MSTITMETNTTAAAPAIIPAPPVSSNPANALRLVEAIPVAPDPEEVTFLDDHPLLPVFVIGAISLALAITVIGSIVFILAIRYSGVMAP